MNSKNTKQSFLENENLTGFSVSITSKNGKTSVEYKARIKPGEPLQTASNDDVSDFQLCAICNALDNF